jgi:hypothetical protein
MDMRILILSENDRWHPFEELSSRIVDWSGELKGVELEVSHDRGVLAGDKLEAYDVCVLCITMGELTDEQEQAIVDFVEGGRGLFAIHSATVVDEKHTRYINLIGGRFAHHSPYHEFQVKIVDSEHPITSGIDDFKIRDELYVLDRHPENAHILATALWEDKVQPLVYTRSYGKGKVLYNAMGHDEAAYDHPAFRKLVVQGLRWIMS